MHDLWPPDGIVAPPFLGLLGTLQYSTVQYSILSFPSFQEFEAPKGVLDLHMVTTNNQKMFKVDLGGIFATVSTDTQSQQAIDTK